MVLLYLYMCIIFLPIKDSYEHRRSQIFGYKKTYNMNKDNEKKKFKSPTIYSKYKKKDQLYR